MVASPSAEGAEGTAEAHADSGHGSADAAMGMYARGYARGEAGEGRQGGGGRGGEAAEGRGGGPGHQGPGLAAPPPGRTAGATSHSALVAKGGMQGGVALWAA
jgi:hypothetical protein